VAAERVLDAGLGHLYARALVAIARADDQIGLEAGLRLQHHIALRVHGAIPLDELLLAEPLEPYRLAESLRTRTSGGPFRNAGLHPGELAVLIVTDAIAIVLAKGYVSEAEAGMILRFASALGCSVDQVRALCSRAAPWLETAI
jgi:hypothetical protein